MDSDGYLWNCRFGGGCISAAYRQRVIVAEIIEMPVTNIDDLHLRRRRSEDSLCHDGQYPLKARAAGRQPLALHGRHTRTTGKPLWEGGSRYGRDNKTRVGLGTWTPGRCSRWAACLDRCTFLLPDGRQVSPLHVAPWGQDPNRATLPTILQELRGEWPCVPLRQRRAALAAERLVGHRRQFRRSGSASRPQLECTLVSWGTCDDGEANLHCIYPQHHPVRELRRRIVPDPRAAAIDITLEIQVDRPCRLPIGLHPTFRLSPEPGSVRLETGAYDHVRSFPGDVEPGAALFQSDRRWGTLQANTTRATAPTSTLHGFPCPIDRGTAATCRSDGTFALHYRHEGFVRG